MIYVISHRGLLCYNCIVKLLAATPGQVTYTSCSNLSLPRRYRPELRMFSSHPVFGLSCSCDDRGSMTTWRTIYTIEGRSLKQLGHLDLNAILWIFRRGLTWNGGRFPGTLS